MSDKYDLVVTAGADEIRVFRVVDACKHPVVFENYTARMQIRPERGSNELLDEYTTENGRLVFTDQGLMLRMPNSATSKYAFRRAVYDIVVSASDGTMTRIVEGRVIVREGVTR